MKKSLLVALFGSLIIAGCASAPKSVSYSEYREENKHDTELVSDKNIQNYAACVRNGLSAYNPKETTLSGNGIRLSAPNEFEVEIYKAIDSTYARADSNNQNVINVLLQCK